MRICAFEYRYGSEEMKRILSIDNLVEKMCIVEAALTRALSKFANAPSKCYEEVLSLCKEIDYNDILKLEHKTGHELYSLTKILSSKVSSECRKYIHLGYTSNDVIDTAWALVIRDAILLIKKKLSMVIRRLIEYSVEYRDVVAIGRTHGQHALPITIGFKLANYVYELARSYERIKDCEKRVVKGKIAGAVGTMAAWGDLGISIQNEILAHLGLKPHEISTQVAPRDGFAELACMIAILASQLDRLALEFRELSRTEIREVEFEPNRIGSSTMPHKVNPVIAERISGLARVVRGFCLPMLENIVLMHERDLTNSSCERIVVPHILLTIDQMLDDTQKMLSTLRFNLDKIRENVGLTRNLIMSECLVVKLVLDKGLARDEAYNIVREVSIRAYKEGIDLIKAFMKSRYSKLLSKEDLEFCSEPRNYLGSYKELIKRAINYAEKVIQGG